VQEFSFVASSSTLTTDYTSFWGLFYGSDDSTNSVTALDDYSIGQLKDNWLVSQVQDHFNQTQLTKK